MRKLCATFEIVTPMFLGGAEQEAKHIRGASIKGALAFWWRALNYERFVIQEKTKDAALSEEQVLEKALVELQKRERELFGGKDGQGRFLLKVIPPKEQKVLTVLERGKGKILAADGSLEKDLSFDPKKPGKHETKNVIGEGARYLGYGLMEAFASTHKKGEWQQKDIKAYAGQLTRSAIAQNQTFELQIIFRSKKDREDPSKKEDTLELEKDFQEIVKALKLFGLLGGLGSRVRRGWGSVSLISLTEEVTHPHKAMEAYTRPKDETDYQNQLKALIGTRTTNGINFRLTAFSAETDVRLGERHSTPLAALNAIGKGFHRYRGWYELGAKKGTPGEQNFKDDHNWFRNDQGVPNKIPLRTAFGLPHNYSPKLGVTVSDENRDVKYDRRASPLMFHVHHLGNNQYVGVASFFPTKFLSTDTVAIEREVREERGRGEQSKKKKKTDVAYNFTSQGLPVIQNFLDGKKPDGSPSSPPYFSSTKLFT